MRIWSTIKQDIKERFLNFETIKGIYLLPAGVLIIFMAILHIGFVIQTAFGVLGVLLILEGLRKIFVNRTKQAVAQDAIRAARDAAQPTATQPVAPVVPVAAVQAAAGTQAQ